MSTTPTNKDLSPRSSIVRVPSSPALSSRHNYQPVSFHRDVFNGENFRAETFLSDCRKRGIALESVLTDLKEYSSSLDNELLELINKDYQDFISLSSNLVGIDKVLSELRTPLKLIHQEVQNLRNSLDDSINVIESKLKERREVLEKKAVLRLCVNVSKSIRKIEKLLDVDSSSVDHQSRPDHVTTVFTKYDEETSNLIERVASEFNQLKFFVSKGKHLPFVKSIFYYYVDPAYIARHGIENNLQQGLEALFKEGITAANSNIISNCLRTYAAIDRMTEAETLFRKWVVKPYAQKTISIEKLEKGNPGSCDGLATIYQQLLQFVGTDCALLLSITQKSIRGFNFLSHSIWPEFAETIIQKIPKIFIPAFPDIFHKNYTVSFKFLDDFENFCTTRAELDTIRTHPAYKDFIKQWNLAIYFPLRFQEIKKKLESSYTVSAQIPSTFSKSAELVLHSSTILWDCLQLCWAPDIFLTALTHRFLKLSMQLIGRYKLWIETAMTEGKELEPGIASLASFTVNQWIYVSYDIQKLSDKISSIYIPHVCQRNAALPSDIVALIKGTVWSDLSVVDSYMESVNSLQSLLPLIGNKITGNITKRCIESLQPLYGVTATYRMTNKEVPTRPTYYVANVTMPLNQFYNDSDTFLLPQNKHAWTLQVLTIVTEKFVEMTNNLLTTVSKQQESLKKMTKKGTSHSSDRVSDVDKIHLQLYLDVEEYGNQIEKFGVSKKNFEPYQHLLKCVTVGQKIRESLNNNSTQ